MKVQVDDAVYIYVDPKHIEQERSAMFVAMFDPCLTLAAGNLTLHLKIISCHGT